MIGPQLHQRTALMIYLPQMRDSSELMRKKGPLSIIFRGRMDRYLRGIMSTSWTKRRTKHAYVMP
jgi:hypothetical protein